MQLFMWGLATFCVIIGLVIPRGIINPHYFSETPDKVEIAKEKALANAKGVVLTYGK